MTQATTAPAPIAPRPAGYYAIHPCPLCGHTNTTSIVSYAGSGRCAEGHPTTSHIHRYCGCGAILVERARPAMRLEEVQADAATGNDDAPDRRMVYLGRAVLIAVCLSSGYIGWILRGWAL